MADTLSIEHATFAQMGPVTHTATRNMPVHCVIFQLGDRVMLLDTGFGTRRCRTQTVSWVRTRFLNL